MKKYIFVLRFFAVRLFCIRKTVLPIKMMIHRVALICHDANDAGACG